MTDSLQSLNAVLKKFATDRNWQQFHNPKNLAMALNVEAAELLEHFQWLEPEQAKNLSTDKLQEVALEIADIQIYLIRISEVLGVDIIKSTKDKIKINQQRFPVGQYTSKPSKY